MSVKLSVHISVDVRNCHCSVCVERAHFPPPINLASRAAPAQNGAFSYGYPSPSMMNGYGPPPVAPPSYAYPPPGQQSGFYQGPPPAAVGPMGYHNPTAPTGRTSNDYFGWGFFVSLFMQILTSFVTIVPSVALSCCRNVRCWVWLHGPTSSISRATSKLGRTAPELGCNSTTFR